MRRWYPAGRPGEWRPPSNVIDLLQKLSVVAEFKVVQRGDQVEAQREALPAVAITLRHDAEDFQAADDMLDHDPAARQLPVAQLLLVREFGFTRLLVRRLALFMQLRQSLVAAVGQHFEALVRLDPAPLVEREVVSRAAAVRGTEHVPGRAVDDDLALQRVPLLLAAVVRPLLFFGRSTGVSATSTTMNSISWSAGCNTFLPGSLKALLLVKTSSTRRMVRQTLDSWMPQLLARWKKVRYSRQYSRVIKTWSSTESFVGRPETRRFRRRWPETTSTILWNVSGLTPQ